MHKTGQLDFEADLTVFVGNARYGYKNNYSDKSHMCQERYQILFAIRKVRGSAQKSKIATA